MKFRFTFSSEDGDQTKDFNNLPDAEEYMNNFVRGVERWSQTTFFPYDSHTSYRLFKDRKGRVIKIDKLMEEATPKLRATITALDKDTIQVLYTFPSNSASDMNLPQEFIDQIYSILPNDMFYQDYRHIKYVDGEYSNHAILTISRWNSAIRKEKKPDSYEAR